MILKYFLKTFAHRILLIDNKTMTGIGFKRLIVRHLIKHKSGEYSEEYACFRVICFSVWIGKLKYFCFVPYKRLPNSTISEHKSRTHILGGT